MLKWLRFSEKNTKNTFFLPGASEQGGQVGAAPPALCQGGKEKMPSMTVQKSAFSVPKSAPTVQKSAPTVKKKFKKMPFQSVVMWPSEDCPPPALRTFQRRCF